MLAMVNMGAGHIMHQGRPTMGDWPSRSACMVGRVAPGRSAPANVSSSQNNGKEQRTFRPLHESQARGRLKLLGDFADPGVSCAL
jgi:hypothetical protein